MKYYSINPIINFIKKNPRPYYRAGDLQQIADTVTNLRRQKLNTPGQERSVGQEDEYLKIIGAVQEKFKGHRKISRPALIRAVNKIITARKIKFRRRRHAPRHENVFFARAVAQGRYVNKEALAAEKYSADHYDVAFYHPEAPGRRKHAHHQHGVQSSVFFVRMEEFGHAEDKMLIGNLQIDANNPVAWAEPARAQVLLSAKTMDLTLVQEAVRYALGAGKKDIYFQDGDAMELAQYSRQSFEEIMITEENYAQYAAEHRQHLEDFAQIAVGDDLAIAGQPTRLVYDKTPTILKIVNYPMSDMTTMFDYLINSHRLPTRENKEQLLLALRKVEHTLRQKKFPETLTALNEFWEEMAQKKLPRRAAAAKLRFLKKHPDATETREFFANFLEDYAQKFNYLEVFHAAFPTVPVIANPRRKGEVYYVDESTQEDIEHFNIKILSPPEVGKVYLKFIGAPNDFFSIYHSGGRSNYNWYHKRVPAALKKLGLACERVKLSAIAVNRDFPAQQTTERTAHAWRIVDGLEDFKRRPLALFASHAQMHTDTVTLRELAVAAKKFNLARNQVKVLDDYICAAGASRTGVYYPQTQTVELANCSLATLAHEGIHHLAVQGLIPPKDYKALVLAGQRLANTAAGREYFAPTGAGAVYAAAPVRQQEAAALFVENYYLTAPRARKKLIGAKLTEIERILDYMERLWEIISARLGNNAARARIFLRRVAEGTYAPGHARDMVLQRPAPRQKFTAGYVERGA